MAKKQEAFKLDPITRVFLEGVYDEQCVLFRLNGLWHLMRRILQHVRKYWKESLIDTSPTRNKMKFNDGDMLSYLNLHTPSDYQRFPFVPGHALDYGQGKLTFPKSSNININMMPFVLEKTFDKCQLPKSLFEYWHQIISNCLFDDNETGKICYLTIHESKVKASHSQRRPGIHTERPGRLELSNGLVSDSGKGQGSSQILHSRIYHHWGIGVGSYNKDSFKIKGGIYMASNVANSCQVWDCQVMDDNCIGHLGDIEHLRSLLPESEIMEPNCLYWLTDRTPHESLPLKKNTHRQFFRLVTSQVSLWFEEHSTKNPLGVVPDPNITKIVRGSKFKKGEAYIA